MATDKYYLGPWRWNATDESYEPPIGALGLVDLRSIPQQATPGIFEGFGFFASDADLGSEYLLLANSLGDSLTPQIRQNVEDMLVLPNTIQAVSLLDTVWEIITSQADPTGVDRCKPLMPTHLKNFELHLGGHSLIKTKKLKRGDPEWSNAVELVTIDYEKIQKESKRKGKDYHRKVMGNYGNKFGLTDDEIQKRIPPSQRERRKKPTTTFSDDFNRGDESLSAGAWAEVAGSFAVVSNQADSGATWSTARANAVLSSADHYAQADTFTGNTGTCVRFEAAANTCYAGFLRPGNPDSRITKITTGTRVTLGTGGTSNTEPGRMEADGSTITWYMNLVSQVSLTDTSHTTGTQGGMVGVQATSVMDNFSEADLLAAAVLIQRTLVGVGV